MKAWAGLVVIGVVNLFFGAVFGLLFVGFDFYIRDLVLTNREIFSGGCVAACAAAADHCARRGDARTPCDATGFRCPDGAGIPGAEGADYRLTRLRHEASADIVPGGGFVPPAS